MTKIKFARVAQFYPKAIESIYQKIDKGLPYKDQLDKIIQSRIGMSDFLTEGLKRIEYDCKEYVYGCSQLSQAWAYAKGKKVNLPEDEISILVDQLREFNPDILFLNIEYPKKIDIVNLLRKEVPSIKMLIGWRCVAIPEHEYELLKTFDLVLTCTPGFLQSFRNRGINCEQLDFGFSEKLNSLGEKPFHERKISANFSGSFNLAENAHIERLQILRKVCKQNLDFTVFADPKLGLGPRKTLALRHEKLYKVLQNFLPEHLRLKNDEIILFNSIRPILPYFREPVFGLDMYKNYGDSRVVINKHIDSAGDWAGNMRLFEATGVGSCLLTDKKKNIGDIFLVGEEIMTYESDDDCIEKLKWLSTNTAAAEKIGMKGRQRTLKNYNYNERVKKLDKLIKNFLSQKY